MTAFSNRTREHLADEAIVVEMLKKQLDTYLEDFNQLLKDKSNG